MSHSARVKLWGRDIGAVTQERADSPAVFQYTPEFARSGIQIAPAQMPLGNRLYQFPQLAYRSFHGLPGLLADSLPDKYGHALIDAWLNRQGCSPEQFSSVERLCYVGTRGMGALEFEPATHDPEDPVHDLHINELAELASTILNERSQFVTSFNNDRQKQAVRDILRVGTSAGGARAKALIAWHPGTNEVRSGQVPQDEGFEYWLLKFDGVQGNRDKELADPAGYGRIEYAYALMARAAGINMSDCRIMEIDGLHHFMTRRFDRTATGGKLHMQTLAALGHYDFNLAGAYSCEQAVTMLRSLRIADTDNHMDMVQELFRRIAFNIVARNQDDHVKNIAFLMDQQGCWKLSPAYDITYSYNPDGAWTSSHQMSLHGKRDNFTLADFTAFAAFASMKRTLPEKILEQVITAVRNWREFAQLAGVPEDKTEAIARTHRLRLLEH